MKSGCSLVSFSALGTMKRAVKELESRGGKNFHCVDSYRDVILSQAYYGLNNKFPERQKL